MYKLVQRNTFTKEKDTVLEIPLRVTEGERSGVGWGGFNQDFGINIYTHSNTSKSINKGLYYSTGNPTQHSNTLWGKTSPKDEIFIYLTSCFTPTTNSALEINYISNKNFNLTNKMNCLLYSPQASVSRAAATSLESAQPWVKGWTVLGYANKWAPIGPGVFVPSVRKHNLSPGPALHSHTKLRAPKEVGPFGLEEL